MTALERYAKLEAVARYLDGASAEAREVVLSFGERSLIIMGLDDRPIAHWPLASLRALTPPAEHPLELVPDPTSRERVLLEDREMGAAIAEVCPNLHLRPPAPRPRGRGLVWAAAAVAAAALAGYALMPPLPDRAVDLVPPAREAALGEAVAARLPTLLGDGAPAGLCTAEEGQAALRALSARLAPAAGLPFPLRLSVLDHPAADALALPGGRVVIFRGLIDAAGTPEALAGVVAHAAGHALRRDPLEAALDRPGLGAAAILFGDATGASAVARAAGAALELAPLPEAEAGADAAGLGILAAAGLPARPFAALMQRLGQAPGGEFRYLDQHPWTAARAARVAAADAVGDAPFRPALGDRDWIALGSICDRTAPSARAP